MAGPVGGIQDLIRRGSGFVKPTAFLFAVDSIANAIDYVFHIFLGRALSPGDFGVFQAVNSALLIAVTAFGVMQPVLARAVAAAKARKPDAARPGETIGLFQAYFRWSALAGLTLGALTLAAAAPLSAALRVPVFAVRYGALVILLVLLRPVLAGTLQGAQQFFAFGATRLAFAAGRLGFAAVALSIGTGLAGAVASLPAGQLLAVAAGAAFLGTAYFRRPPDGVPSTRARDGLRLAGWAFAAFSAFTALQNLDLLFVNRYFAPAESGAYAAAVLLRRILILFPGAAAVVMYPRIVAKVAHGELPDLLLGMTLAFVSVPILLLAAGYALFGPQIVSLAFGPGYETAGPLLGVMGITMLAYGMGSVWMNVFLATRPGIFVSFLCGAALVQAAGLALWHADLAQVVRVFAATGWLIAAGGALVYWFGLRPGLVRGVVRV